MIFAGLQKLTLLDYPGMVACTVFTRGCDLRCPFCHNASLALAERESDSLPEAEVLAFLEKRRGLLDAVAVTGGEPLMQRELPEFLAKLRDMGYMIKLDTNGTFPERLRSVVEAGLVDRVAMDIKSSPEGYPAACGVANLDLEPIRKSADYLMSCGIAYEFRTTVVKGIHTEADIVSAGRWISGAKEYWLQGFRDSGDLIAPDGLGAFSDDEMKHMADLVRPFVPSVGVRGI